MSQLKLEEALNALRVQKKAWEGVLLIECDGPLADFAEKQIKRIKDIIGD
jgi:hypothetical protein